MTLARTFSAGDPASATSAVDPKRQLVYVGAADGGEQIAIFHEGSHRIRRIPLETDSNTIAVDSRSGDAYFPDAAQGTVRILRGTHLVGTLQVGNHPEDVVVQPKSGLAYVSDSADSKLTVLAGDDVRNVVTLPTGSQGEAVNAKTGTVYVRDVYGSARNDTVTAINGLSVSATLPVGSGGGQIAVDSVRGRVYVANYNDGTVTVLREHQDAVSVIGTLTVGMHPGWLAVDRRNGLVYVANQDSSSISILRGNSVVKTIQVRFPPYVPAVNPATHVVTVTSEGHTVYVLHGTKLVEQLQLPSPGFYSQFDQTTRRDFINFGSGQVAVLQAPARPTITLQRPRAGHSYIKGTRAIARFACRASANNPVTSCRGTVPRNHRIHHSRIGRHTFVVRANPTYGKTVTKVVHYRIVRAGA